MNAESTGRFSSKRCKKATELDAAGVVLEYERNDPVGARHIFLIAASESLQHHSFFLRDSSKKQDPKTDKSSETQFGSNSAWAAAQSQKAEYMGCRIFR
jgi:hypothetical protein